MRWFTSLALPLSLLCAACGVEGTEPEAPPPVVGDGVCEIAGPAAAPDVDCFRFFASDEQAATTMPADRGPALSTDEPSFRRARRLLDDAWTLYGQHVAVGELADVRVALVVVQNDAPNAFVRPSRDGVRGIYAVTVHTGLLDARYSDDQVTAVLLHELQHLSGLHWLPDVVDGIRAHYLAPRYDGEPVGARMTDDPTLGAEVEAWRTLAASVGPDSDAHLADLPIGGAIGAAFEELVAENSTCAAGVDSLRRDLEAARDPLAGSLAPSDALAARIAPVLAALASCITAQEPGSLDELAASHGWTGLELEHADGAGSLDAVAGLRALTGQRRAALRDIELESASPWSSVRYFSFEEMADDTATRILRDGGHDMTALGEMLAVSLGAQTSACESAIAGGTVAYGIDLRDEHHATCWRIAHSRQVAAIPTVSARLVTSPNDQPRSPRPATSLEPIE